MSLPLGLTGGIDTIMDRLVGKLGGDPTTGIQQDPGIAAAGLMGASYGPREVIVDTPWAWVQNSSWAAPPFDGGDLEVTQWEVLARLFCTYVTDSSDGERRLTKLVEPIRAALRADQKLSCGLAGTGLMQVARAIVVGGGWGYMEVNGIVYRYLDMTIQVTEKYRAPLSIGV